MNAVEMGSSILQRSVMMEQSAVNQTAQLFLMGSPALLEMHGRHKLVVLWHAKMAGGLHLKNVTMGIR